MAKQSMIQREIKREKLIEKYKDRRKQVKKITKTYTKFTKYYRLTKKLQEMPRNSMKCRHRNRCWMTGRSRGVYRDFGLSRHVFREMSHSCLLPGVRKSSW
uniref:Small ribosomal subunit protein uS14c n=1 Tax=Cumathamnion serrulatum TaxID=1206573 RepID=A0A7U1AR36_9FLOR|nr:ribosomal protein S14 [Cumathamnion serrulatum]QQY85382.1 ribosomal protein S14 [Cumathamnion serrulatum]